MLKLLQNCVAGFILGLLAVGIAGTSKRHKLRKHRDNVDQEDKETRGHHDPTHDMSDAAIMHKSQLLHHPPTKMSTAARSRSSGTLSCVYRFG